MKKCLFLFFWLLLMINRISGQVIAPSINFFGPSNFIQYQSDQNQNYINPNSETLNTGVYQLFQNWDSRKLDLKKLQIIENSFAKNGDTLYIGIIPNDSLVVTGLWVHSGPIVILGDGKLVFDQAQATILGDIWVWGDHAKVISSHSSLYFPQQYFYQRSLVAAGKGQFVFDHTSLDFSGLSHNFVATDSAQFILKNVTKNGFTTNGLSKNAKIEIDSTNLAGEFICSDQIQLICHSANTLLLWHQIPNGGMLNHTFPAPDTVASYHFSNSSPGVQNINYAIDIDTCTDVMWALMPTSGSSINISNSTIKAVGVWFENSGNIPISGLTNNSNYSDFIPEMSDKYIHFTNCKVAIWNLYTFKQSEITLSGSILGEIGSMGKSKITCQNAMIDGSGGYTWATDTTVLIVGYASAVNDFRATKNSFAVFSYSSLLNGVAMATDNAIMIVNQSSTPDFPVAYDQSCVWYNKIESPASGSQNSIIEIMGSSYIEKTPTSNWMDFGWYQLFFKSPSDLNWTPITDKITTPVRDGVLAQWNTNSLSPNNYLLKLVLCDNTIDSNQVEAIKSINILPSILSVNANLGQSLKFYYQQKSNVLNFDPSFVGKNVTIYTIQGKILYKALICQEELKLPQIAHGVYFAKIDELNLSLKFEYN